MTRGESHEIRFGLIKATISEKSVRGHARHRVKIVRLYKDGDVGKESQMFGRDDLPLVAKVADLSHTWIYQHSQRDGIGVENHDSEADSFDE